ncbi:MAG: trypsin-like serine protease [Labilithrix sp.]
MLAFLLVACASSRPEHEETKETGRAVSPIVGGTDSPSSEDFVVSITLPPDTFCSGILVSPRLVLTAKHCIGGNVAFGTFNDQQTCTLRTAVGSPENFKIALGARDDPPTATLEVSRVFADLSKLTCDNDVAALELKESVTGINFRPLQLDSPAVKDESVDAIGFGVVDDNRTTLNVRQRSTGRLLPLDSQGRIDRGGQTATPSGSSVSVPGGYVLASMLICQGDSGGPLVRSATGDILGLLHGVLAGGDSKVGSCSDSVAVYIPFWTQTAFIERVFQTQGLMPTRVGRSSPPSDVGGRCAQNNDCHSNYCVKIGSDAGVDGTCSKVCTASTDCPTSMECTATGNGFSVCLAPPPPPPDSSCNVASSTSPASPSRFPLLAGFLALCAGTLARRRRKAS